ncbi:sensor histidine kinase [Roseateles sp. BYS180W]|uniref:Sensor histidine kinase n=1 Tax=Roseateles rivi TaxID=3299028 RepID=A0ABW7FT67_9BURK
MTTSNPPSSARPLRAQWLAFWRGFSPAMHDEVRTPAQQLVATVLFSVFMAVFFTLLWAVFNPARAAQASAWAWLSALGRNLVVSGCVGGAIHGLFALVLPRLGGHAAIRQRPSWQRSLIYAGLPMLGVALGWPLGMALSGNAPSGWFWSRSGTMSVLIALGLSACISLVVHVIYAAREREREQRRRATEAQLQLLQAQMEPHFLFNTLANVQALIEDEPARAQAMLGAFTTYLRASLQGLRQGAGTLGAELDLLRAYLAVLQQRMGPRLRVQVEVDEALLALPLPPLLLQPLVENAVHHGVEPKLEGGTVWVRAWREGERLELEVRDDGVGLGASRRGGHGLALQNLRARLAARWVDAAQLQLSPAEPGCRVRLSLPIDPPTPAHP